MKKIIAACLFTVVLCLITQPSIASESGGLLLGGGVFGASSLGDNESSYYGNYLEVGYDLNHVVGFEAKYVFTYSSSEDLKINFIGVNAGHDFNTGWFRLYGKVGFASIKAEHDFGFSESSSESSITAGVGARFTVSGKARGVYVKVEGMGVEFPDRSSIGVVLLVGTGYRF